MGQTHARAYAGNADAVVTAIADPRPNAIARARAGNLDTGEADLDLDGVLVTQDPSELLARSDVDAVSICTPTPTHVPLALQAIDHHKHALVEKPLALTSCEADRVTTAAAPSGLVLMPAMCMRFWPEWRWLKRAIDDRLYGSVLSASFTRLGARPGWGQGFYADPAKCGGAILDLHIHDTDFVRWCFGDPQSVSAVGVSGPADGIDHVVATYHYHSGPMVVAQGGWIRSGDYPFTMRFVVEFEQASVRFDFSQSPTLSVFSAVGCEHPQTADEDGYAGEVRHFLTCIRNGSRPDVELMDAAASIALIETERTAIAEQAVIPFGGAQV